MERMKVVIARLKNQEQTKYVKKNIRLERKQIAEQYSSQIKGDKSNTLTKLCCPTIPLVPL